MLPFLALVAPLPLRFGSLAPPLPIRCLVEDRPVDEADTCDAEAQYCTTSLGVRYLDTQIGDGDEATAASGSVVRVSFSASLLSSGEVIGASGGMRGPLRFALGRKRLVFWEDAIEGMCVGGTRRLLIPPSAKMTLRATNERM